MKKRGFTLIELLAVIVILAIIALIATPIIMNTISNSKKAAAERSAERYASAVETMIATERLDNEVIADGTYSINISGNLVVNGVEKPIDMTGTKPKGGNITIKDGVVVKSSATTIAVGEYIVSYDSNSKIVASIPTAFCTLESGEAYAVGSKYTCNPGDGNKTFYVLESTTDTVSLIMDRNIDEETVSFCVIDEENGEDPGTAGFGGCTWATSTLNTKTSGWTSDKIVSKQLPTYTQIYNVNNSTDLTSSSWLYGDAGYWTSSDASDVTYTTDSIWVVSDSGELRAHIVYQGNQGIRPVMTVLKSDI